MAEREYGADARAIDSRAQAEANAAWSRYLSEMNAIGERAKAALLVSARKNGMMNVGIGFRVVTREASPDLYKPQIKISDGLWYTG